MTKYLKKFKELPKALQKLLSTKLTNGDVEIVEMENEKTIIQATVNTSYNRNMRSKSFEKIVLDFIKEQKETNRLVQEQINEIKNILIRNNLK